MNTNTTTQTEQTTAQVYERASATDPGKILRDSAEPSGTYYREGTPRAVINALETARQTGARIRLFYGDHETGASWNEENDVTGTVSRSTGAIKTPLLVASARSFGGGCILTDCIVCLHVNGREVYRSKLYKHTRFAIQSGFDQKYPVEVLARGSIHARFQTEKKAARYIDFVSGKRAAK